jgi:HEAT repeat protein
MDSTTEIRTIVQNSSRREKLLTQGSIALGLLGDKAIAEELVRKMEEQGTVAVMSALAQALGFIGDRRSIDPLVEILGNKGLKDIPRAFAAVALGLVGDKEDLPWNSKVAVNANYRANVETLTSSSGTGILDIL